MSHLSLTADEQFNILGQKGDCLEVIYGVITFTGSRQYAGGTSSLPTPVFTEQTFVFESNSPKWGTRDWTLSTETQIPNGRALLVLYCRGNQACAYGIVSLINRAWTHTLPLMQMPLYKNSDVARQLVFSRNMMLACDLAFIIFCGLIAGSGGPIGALIILAALRMIPFTRTLRHRLFNVRDAKEVASTVRSFMFRIAKNAEQFTPDGGSSGKL